MLPYKIRLFLKVISQSIFGKATNLVSDEAFNKLLFRIMFGRKADFEHPKSFSEFVCARKIKDDAFNFWPYTDKYEVRDYVRRTIGEQYLNECYGVYNCFEDIDFTLIPDKFVLRGTHGSGYNMVVSDKSNMDMSRASKQFGKWLKKNYYHRCRERNYFEIKPRICCDRFIESKSCDGLPEMKIYCFGGKARFICYDINKNGKTYTNVYDEKWNYLDIRKGYDNFEDKSVPQNSDEILRIAENLAAPFEFVRVDLYNVDEQIIFSELTFFSGGGLVPFDPPEYDEIFAKYFKNLEKNER